MDIIKLAHDLKAQGIDSFELKFTFKNEWPDSFKKAIEEKPETPAKEEKQVEVPVSPGLAMTMDAEMDPDKILNWSSPDAEAYQVPLAGDQAL